MRLVKTALCIGLVVGLGFLWVNRAPVVDAYRSDLHATAELRLGGIDLAYQPTELAPSPYRLPAAPDTRRADAGFPAVLPSAVVAARPIPVLGGTTMLEGTVMGPDGPVAGAQVRIERVTNQGVGSVDAVADEQGKWRVQGAFGGRFRVRAWLPNELTMSSSVVRWVGFGDSSNFEFTLVPADPAPTLELVHGGSIYAGLASEVALVASTRYIDELGLSVARPLPEVAVEVDSGDLLVWPKSVATGADGSTRINVRCELRPEESESDPQLTTEADTPNQAPAEAPDEVPSSGTLTATTNFGTFTFAVPGCLPLPELEPESAATENEVAQ